MKLAEERFIKYFIINAIIINIIITIIVKKTSLERNCFKLIDLEKIILIIIRQLIILKFRSIHFGENLNLRGFELTFIFFIKSFDAHYSLIGAN